MNSSKGHTAYISLDQDVEQASPFPLFIISLKLDLLYLSKVSLFSYEIEISLSPSHDFFVKINKREYIKMPGSLP